MSLAFIQYCDGPECDRHVQVRSLPSIHFLTVSRRDDVDLHFCGWDCVLRHASQQEPETIIPFEEET